jgi:subtilisin family serine protease
VRKVRSLKIGQAPGEPLRIAIIDSGIDFSNEEFDNGERDRIKEMETFIGGDPDKDTNGHGTYVASILLRLTADNVELYIAKVTDSKKPTKVAVMKVRDG